MMIRMRNLDDVTAVNLAKSVRKDEADSADAPAPAEQGAAGDEEISDCTGSARVTTFEITVEFGGATTSAAAPATAAVPPGARPRSPMRTLQRHRVPQLRRLLEARHRDAP